MSNFNLIKGNCAVQNVDAVVNAANRNLRGGSGICGVIFKACGWNTLQAACDALNPPVKDGEAVITPAFNMKNARHIIHAVGPDFGSTPKAFLELFNAYYNSLVVLKDNNLHSISFPLISAGIFGGNLPDPAGESAKQCSRAYKKFIQDYPDYNVDVMLCAYADDEYKAAAKELGIEIEESKLSPKDCGRWDNVGIKIIDVPGNLK
ncbi:MAG: macro domain-containing protein [Spirochaetales bacterium]|nr:macro domain-containing protein [Spirochaetales bacterium]